MISRFRPFGLLRTSRVSVALPVLALAGALLLPDAAHAQTVVTPTAATGSTMVGTIGVVPAGPTRSGAVTVVAAAIDTSGDVEIARRALGYANEALKVTPGYSPMPASQYIPLTEKLAKEATKTDWGWPFTATDYQKIGKLGKAPNAMTITVSPTNGGYDAVAEMYDTARGALTGYGKSSASGENGLQTAIGDAVTQLGKTAELGGIIISKPSGYLARVSLGTLVGARGGARIEYLDNDGTPFAFGTIFDIAPGEGLATVAPETAYSRINVNGRVRLVNNPSAKRALPDFTKKANDEYKKFETQFGISLATATAVYFLAGGK